ncbi:MAG: preprotein translocase subunit SecA [Candidatus Krumholzibacteria bacterium]|nr:preprotein translocase subunit SecA [Candidatus Krumholzibacteria bacterium]MDH4337145.1 preprotein translocase subunit SecA [Candidatus Krumholzibacteria bacterium]MDH5269137.1 preprotein translocase subunit SecA [Candidatus Krumholzibacteria bacterium]MDH5626986.1 preprotein translocase subunit SecA [Candidatus Krumholzibacteria bacterium]
MKLIEKLFKPKATRDFKRQQPILDEVNRRAEEYAAFTPEQFRAKTDEFRGRIAAGETTDDLLPEAFGLVKAACRALMGTTADVVGIPTTWEMVPYDVQIVGGIVLHQGKIAEMATGEGKTLVATFPLYLNSLTGKGVHLITVNDYLARRDSEWMGRVFEHLGVSVGCVQGDVPNDERKASYAKDITYGTNNEFGFDYLRDNMKTRAEDRVQRGHHYAIVDEVDSVLIDEARTPLIISGPVSHSKSSDLFAKLKPKVERVVSLQARLANDLVSFAEKHKDDEDKEEEVARALLKVKRGAPRNTRFMKLVGETGIEKMIQRMEVVLMRDKVLTDLDEELYYAVDEKGSSLNLTDKGRDALSPEDREQFVLPDLSEEIASIDEDESLTPAERVQKKDEAHRHYGERSESIHNFSQLLRAYTLFQKDVEYVVQEGRVIIVDEFTGRLMPGRRFSEGLHQALEAKEGVRIEGETQTLATITLQNYFRMYEKLAGMTGTAETEAEELHKIYKLDVQVVPTNEPVRRVDYEDLIYKTRREKYNAIVDEIVRLHEQKLPVLVGTISVEVSETLSRFLKRRGIAHNVLNAKYHQQEAEIVSKAGRAGAVTIATNMAGRGTDIKLEASVMKCDECGIGTGKKDWKTKDGGTVDTNACAADVPCGLHIIGTERHESRRIDRQLRGRAGRQGDPGASVFYISLEDDLMRLFRPERIAGVMDRLGLQEGEVITHSLVTKSIARSQKRVEGYNFEIRKRLIDYDDVMNKQREVIYGRRNEVIDAPDLRPIIETIVDDFVESAMATTINASELPENQRRGDFLAQMESIFLHPFPAEEAEGSLDDLREAVGAKAREALRAREDFLSRQLNNPELVREFEKFVLLQVMDEKWMDHLHELDSLKEGIHYRAYAQKDPLVEYKREAFGLFADLNERIDRDALHAIFHARIAAAPRQVADLSRARAVHQEAAPIGAAQPAPAASVSGGPAPISGPVPGPLGGPMGATEATSRVLQDRPTGKPVVRGEEKVGRNDPCPCGSGKKYKKCHGAST